MKFLPCEHEIFTTNPDNGRTLSWSDNSISGGLLCSKGGKFLTGDYSRIAGWTLVIFGLEYAYHKKCKNDRKDVREDDNKGH